MCVQLPVHACDIYFLNLSLRVRVQLPVHAQVRKAMQSVGMRADKEKGAPSTQQQQQQQQQPPPPPEEKDSGVELPGSLTSPRLVSTQTFLKLVKQYAGRKVNHCTDHCVVKGRRPN